MKYFCPSTCRGRQRKTKLSAEILLYGYNFDLYWFEHIGLGNILRMANFAQCLVAVAWPCWRLNGSRLHWFYVRRTDWYSDWSVVIVTPVWRIQAGRIIDNRSRYRF